MSELVTLKLRLFIACCVFGLVAFFWKHGPLFNHNDSVAKLQPRTRINESSIVSRIISRDAKLSPLTTQSNVEHPNEHSAASEASETPGGLAHIKKPKQICRPFQVPSPSQGASIYLGQLQCGKDTASTCLNQAACARSCASATYFQYDGSKYTCQHVLPTTASGGAVCSWYTTKAISPRGQTFTDANGPSNYVDIYSFVNERLASLWHSCRLARYSRQYIYRVYDMRFQQSLDAFVERVLPFRPGTNIIVLNACCVNGSMLQHWPINTTLVLAADESARWGFSHSNGKHFWGPHGSSGPLKTDENGHMVIPERLGRWLKQYYSPQQQQTYSNLDFLPLGSRREFPESPAELKPATLRKYVYSFMGAPTNLMRRYLDEVLGNDTLIPSDKAFFHLAEHWFVNPDDPRSGYVNTTDYARIVEDSVFTLCPKGHSVEQYRIYEAVESGSIPVLALEGGYTLSHLPPSYTDSGMVFVDDWKDAPHAMVTLLSNPSALLDRQRRLLAWYADYMHGRIAALETAIQSNIRRQID
eukprot:TRINITY_DN11979_c1_g8_i1.p1 TRINITY_DN11979_c1_g8~~TRINITY_DN11979_c1_g8_i1.p1  ORF type:complete len:529 (+),score=60.66 TRINITY_DN11979_c1_g8_i1:116-1702(+)